MKQRKVAPLAGAWIEIVLRGDGTWIEIVAPLAGAWIEILNFEVSKEASKSLPSRERGLKSRYL